MKYRNHTLKILALIISMIMMLAGCNSGSAAAKSARIMQILMDRAESR